MIWAGTVAIGSAKMLRYEFTPGPAGRPSAFWPSGSDIHPESHCARLVMVVHPRCPCTRASIAELAQVMTRAQGSVAAYLLFYRPRTFPPGWEQTDLWRSAAAIPGVTVIPDPEGREAQRFGAVTSGDVRLYDRAGQLLFTGGITGSRGHVGDNAGCDSVIRLLTCGAGDGAAKAPRALAARPHTFVYGCPIRADGIGSGK
jgi:hypothetical protein